MKKQYVEFNIERFTIGDYLLMLGFMKDPHDPLAMILLIERMKQCTDVDIEQLPFEQLGEVVEEYMDTLKLYMQEHGFLKP